MPIAAGLNKQLAYKIETTYGAAPGQSGGQQLRRVESSLDLTKETYESNEKRPDLQTSDMRHGVRRVSGSISGELSPGTYEDLFAVTLKRDFVAVTNVTGASITIAGSGPTYTLTRAAGSWLTDGCKQGDVVRLTAGTFNVANSNKNLFVLNVTATVLTVMTLNGSPLVAEGPVASATLSWPGKKSFIPTSGHTDRSIAFEHWYPDLGESELFLGNKIARVALGLPPTGMATVNFEVMGQDVADTVAKRSSVALTSQYFTSPTGVTTTGVLAAVNGVLRVGGVTIATITGLDIEIAPAYGGKAVVGSNIVPGLFPDRVRVSGNLTAYFETTALRNAFWNETEIDVMAALTTDNSAAADFMSFVMHRIKVGGASKNDPSGDGIEQTIPFTALLNGAGGAGVQTERTTFGMQDSQA